MVQNVSKASDSANTSGITEPINALAATNLDQWKAIISGLKQFGDNKYHQDWVMEQTNRISGVPMLLETSGQTVSYKVRFIDITIINETGKILCIETHSPIMNIDETRELGSQLFSLFGWDSKGFLKWCDKVGNHWLDAPLFTGGDLAHTFNVRNTFNNEKPWYIEFDINNP